MPRTDWQRARLKSLLKEVRERIGETYGEIADLTEDEYRGLVQVTTDGIISAVNDAVGASLLVAPKWTAEQLAEIAGDALIQGAPNAEWWARQSVAFQQYFADQIRMGMLRGETVDQLRDRILPRVDLRTVAPESRPAIWTARRNAEALVRTATMTVSNQAHLASYLENSDIIDSLQWVATLDGRTCLSCASMDLKQWKLGKAHQTPPLHWNCRCSVVPITKTWEQLLGKKSLAKELDAMAPGMRASMGGQVSADTTYEGWFADQKASRQKEILGQKRYELYQRGQLKLAEMVDGKGSPLTLEQLREKRK
jgi:SPP1 gp7 family putative phage head morphogenesis protein